MIALIIIEAPLKSFHLYIPSFCDLTQLLGRLLFLRVEVEVDILEFIATTKVVVQMMYCLLAPFGPRRSIPKVHKI